MESLSKYPQEIMGLVAHYAGSAILAIVVLIIGFWTIRLVNKRVSKLMEKHAVDLSLRPFLKTCISVLLKIMLILAVLSMVGIQIASFIAVLGTAGLAIGLALQGSLSNFAGGVILLLLKPIKVGHFVEANGFMGTVREIHLFYTFITTTQNQEVIMPNGQLANAAIKNYSWHDTRRMDIDFRITYKDDIDKAKMALNAIMTSEETLLKDPELMIYVNALAENHVQIHIRAWFKSSDYWDVYNGLSEKVKKRFDQEGISVPYPNLNISTDRNLMENI